MYFAIAVLAPLVGSVSAALLRPLLGWTAAIAASLLFMAVSVGGAMTAIIRHLYAHVPTHTVVLEPWVTVGHFSANWALRMDTLSLVVVGMVSLVSAIIHLYSVGYMEDDDSKPRFFVYISLFTFAMLALVTANNLLQLFFGWEGVGLVSYLLIGYWYEKASANEAAIKAFIVNRVGDLFFAIGIVIAYLQFHSLSFNTIFAEAPKMVSDSYHLFGHQLPVLEVISILLFIGAMGKSAQLFLHTWLPDAMEGPTPISALIHAATMVAAGVYMVVRMSPIISHAPVAMAVITVIGGFTAFFTATIGCVQNDIKRIIAYSTCSQLGYMFLGAGVGADPAAIFHMLNHAFFKALLFLCAGAVIHSINGEQDVRKMGALYRKMPLTYIMMWAGALALAAIPPFNGYYSKDLIISSAFAHHTWPAMFGWACGTAGAGLTAFYITRLIYLTFHGNWRGPREDYDHAHETTPSMAVPLVFLGIGSLVNGVLLVNTFTGPKSGAFWGSSIIMPAGDHVMRAAETIPHWADKLPLLLALIGWGVATVFYISAPRLPVALARQFPASYAFLLNKWYFDELYDRILVRPALAFARFAWRIGDEEVIDGVPTGLARLTSEASGGAVRLQSGSIAVYGFVTLIGLMILVSVFLFIR